MGARFGICPIPERSERKTGQIGAGGGLPEPVVYKVQTTLSNLPSMNFSRIVRPVMSAASGVGQALSAVLTWRVPERGVQAPMSR
jgi:hypothetical protein